MPKPNWLTITPTSGNGNGTIRFSATPHTGRVLRTYAATIANNKTTDCQITVNQAAKSASGATDWVEIQGSASATKEGGQLTITGQANATALTFSFKTRGSVTIPLPENYMAASQSTANGAAISGDPGATNAYNFSVTLTVPENTTIEERTSTLVVTTDGGATAQCIISQAAGDPYLWVGTEDQTEITVSIPQEGTEQSVSVLSNDAWSVS